MKRILSFGYWTNVFVCFLGFFFFLIKFISNQGLFDLIFASLLLFVSIGLLKKHIYSFQICFLIYMAFSLFLIVDYSAPSVEPTNLSLLEKLSIALFSFSMTAYCLWAAIDAFRNKTRL